MRYHGDHHVLPLFGPWRWAPYMRGNFHWKKYQCARSIFLSHTSKLNQQKQWDVVSKSTAYISVVLLLTNHETPYNLKILCWASTHLLSQSVPFLQLQVSQWPVTRIDFQRKSSCLLGIKNHKIAFSYVTRGTILKKKTCKNYGSYACHLYKCMKFRWNIFDGYQVVVVKL